MATASAATNFSKTTTGKEVVKAFATEVDGKTFVVTGASKGGLGAEAILALATANPKLIILAGRSEAKIAPVMEQVKELNPKTQTQFVKMELGNLASLRETAKEISNSIDQIDVLINNAGVMAVEKYDTTDDGIESQLGFNHVGPFLLTNLLISKLGDGSRVVNVTSTGYEMSGIRFDDWNFDYGKTYNPWLAYGQSKTANVLFAQSLAKKLAKKGAYAFVVHPGLIMSSNLMNNVSQEMFMDGLKIASEANGGQPTPPEFEKTLEQGCSTHMVAALDPSITSSSGSLLVDAQLFDKPVKEHARGAENQERLWALSEQLVGEKFDI